MAKRPRCGSSAEAAHGRPRTTSCGFEATETIPFPGADSIFSSRCGAISGRLRFVVTPARAAIPATKTPRFQRSTIGSAVSSDKGGRGASESSRKFAVWAEPVGNGGPP
jgi:hypothetical protein